MTTPALGLARLQAALSPSVFNVVLSATATLTFADQQLPVEASRAGSVFTDRFDPKLRWYLPAYSLPAEDSAFAFAASQQGTNSETGLPYDAATLTLTIASGEPPDVTAARAADPTLTFRPIALNGLQLTLTCPARNSSGDSQPVSVPLTSTAQADGSLLATATLTGPTVVVVYQGLAHSTDAVIQVSGSYSVWRQWQRWSLPPTVFHGSVPSTSILQLSAPTVASATSSAGTAHLAAGSIFHVPIGHRPVQLPPPKADPVHPIDPPPSTWMTVVDSDTQVLPATGYQTDANRSRFTIVTEAGLRPIIDAGDLTSYAQQRSLFRELTSLGDISTTYPSVRRAYLDQASGAVIAIPQSYGILRGSDGLAAILEAVADDSGSAQSGCRFEFSFTLAPLVDPVDLAQLAHDLASTPEAKRLTLQLGLPDSLDMRFASSFAGFQAAVTTVSDGPRPGTVQVHVQIADVETTPAICNANLFLHQFASSTAPMTGQVSLRLDDVYPTPVSTSFQLSLGATAGSADVSLTADDDGITAGNSGRFDLELIRAASIAPDGVHAESLAVALAPGATVPLAAIDDTAVTLVSSILALPDPMPPGHVFDYLTVHTETVMSVHHSLLYSASFDFAKAGVAQLDVSASLVDLPSVSIGSVTLTPTHFTDFAPVTVPIDSLVTGLTAQVRLTVTGTDGSSRMVDLTYDFLADPLLTITSATLSA